MLLAHCVYLINVVGQMFFTDAFLGNEFSKYEHICHAGARPKDDFNHYVTACRYDLTPQFIRYGLASAISQLDLEPSDRIDPMSEVFQLLRLS